MVSLADECAREVLEVVPLVMRAIRGELRTHRRGDVSIPQFRTLLFLNGHENASLSEVAEHIGLTLPSMSRIVDILVNRGLATRDTHRGDRRRMTLILTTRGRTTLRLALKATETYLRTIFMELSPTERGTVVNAMKVLRPVFTKPRDIQMKS
jgi:DNA-binding MarR family transcriptional regulator